MKIAKSVGFAYLVLKYVSEYICVSTKKKEDPC